MPKLPPLLYAPLIPTRLQVRVHAGDALLWQHLLLLREQPHHLRRHRQHRHHKVENVPPAEPKFHEIIHPFDKNLHHKSQQTELIEVVQVRVQVLVGVLHRPVCHACSELCLDPERDGIQHHHGQDEAVEELWPEDVARCELQHGYDGAAEAVLEPIQAFVQALAAPLGLQVDSRCQGEVHQAVRILG